MGTILNSLTSGFAQYRPDHHGARTQRDSSGAEHTHPARAALAVDGEVWSSSRAVLLDASLLVAYSSRAVLLLYVPFTTDHGVEGAMLLPHSSSFLVITLHYVFVAFCCMLSRLSRMSLMLLAVIPTLPVSALW